MSSQSGSGKEEDSTPEAEGDVISAAMEQVELGDGEDAEFSLEVLIKHFDKSTAIPGLHLASYVKGYREVYKFLNLLGTVFGWVGSDVWAKIVTLQKYLDGSNKDNYQNIKEMIAYEMEHDLIKTKKRDDPSGTRTLLRLHRALEYIIAFLDKLEGMQDSDLCSVISVESYEATLMKYHPWVVQKAAKVAMKLLPTKGGLILKVHPEGSQEGIKKTLEDFPKAVSAMRTAYDSLQHYYQENNLLDIP